MTTQTVNEKNTSHPTDYVLTKPYFLQEVDMYPYTGTYGAKYFVMGDMVQREFVSIDAKTKSITLAGGSIVRVQGEPSYELFEHQIVYMWNRVHKACYLSLADSEANKLTIYREK